MRQSCILVALALLLFSSSLKAQDKEIGGFLGTTLYQGDLSQKQITLNETKVGVGALMRYYFMPELNFKGGLYLGWIEGDDKNYPDDPWRVKRNTNFKTHVVELSGQMEYNILRYISNSRRYKFTPFVFVGLGIFHFNPYTTYNGDKVKLQPLGTEGQTLPGGSVYHRLQVSIPYGVGIKYSLGNYWNIGFEFGQRKIFTDYLDDMSNRYADRNALAAKNPTAAALSDRSWEVSTKYQTNKGGVLRGDPKHNDMYIFTGFTITKTLRRFSCIGH